MSYRKVAREGSRARPSRPAGGAVDVRLAAVPEAASAARSAVADALTGHVERRVLADAELLVSELVTNSIQNAGPAADELVRGGAAVTHGVVRLVVEDPGSTGTIAARDPGAEGSGFGLHLVDALAHAWGVSRDGATRVWVELVSWPPPRAPVVV
jgi:anti-sigma regulatory factor (Ser/Thr protein kinase)